MINLTVIIIIIFIYHYCTGFCLILRDSIYDLIDVKKEILS